MLLWKERWCPPVEDLWTLDLLISQTLSCLPACLRRLHAFSLLWDQKTACRVNYSEGLIGQTRSRGSSSSARRSLKSAPASCGIKAGYMYKHTHICTVKVSGGEGETTLQRRASWVFFFLHLQIKRLCYVQSNTKAFTVHSGSRKNQILINLKKFKLQSLSNMPDFAPS